MVVRLFVKNMLIFNEPWNHHPTAKSFSRDLFGLIELDVKSSGESVCQLSEVDVPIYRFLTQLIFQEANLLIMWCPRQLFVELYVELRVRFQSTGRPLTKIFGKKK